MKRLSQFVSVLAILLLAGQPMLTRASCAWGSASEPCMVACPMGMSQMGMDCRMADRMGAAGCPLNCCQSALQPAMARLTTPARPRLALLHTVAVILPAVAGTQLRLAIRPPGAPPLGGRERHILLQVFRI
jgi:hypothetical protein